MDSNEALNDRIVRGALDWVGVPYLKEGKTKNGTDCIFSIAQVLYELDLLDALPDGSYRFNYWQGPGDPMVEAIERARATLVSDGYALMPWSVDDLRPGCILTVSHLAGLEKSTHGMFVVATHSHSIEVVHARQNPEGGGEIERTRKPSSWKKRNCYRMVLDG